MSERHLAELAIFLAIALFTWLVIMCCESAYDNGVNDGYGYAREPDNPGYAKAGRYLRKYCGHRWQELLDVKSRWGPRLKDMM